MVTTLLLFVWALQAVGSAPPIPSQPIEIEGEWTVEVIDNIKVMPDSTVTLRFQGRRVSGLSSCNSYSGTYTFDASTLKTDSVLTTMKACSAELMSQERDFLRVLRNARRYELRPPGSLILTTEDGRTLTARRK